MIYLILVLYDMESSWVNKNPKKQWDLDIFILGLMKSGKWCRNMIH